MLQLSSAEAAGGAVDAVARRYRLENGNSLGEKDEVSSAIFNQILHLKLF